MNEDHHLNFIHQAEQFVLQIQQLFPSSQTQHILEKIEKFIINQMLQTKDLNTMTISPNNNFLSQQNGLKNPNILLKQIEKIDIKTLFNQLMRMKSKIKFVLSLFIIAILSMKKQKPLTTLLGFYYELLNLLIKELYNQKITLKRTPANCKKTQEAFEKEQKINTFCIKIVADFFSYLIQMDSKFVFKKKIVSEKKSPSVLIKSMNVLNIYVQDSLKSLFKNQSISQTLSSYKSSKILKTLSSILCLPEQYFQVSDLLDAFLIMQQLYVYSGQILHKIEYKFIKKLEKYTLGKFSQSDIVKVLKISLKLFDDSILQDTLNQVFIQNEPDEIRGQIKKVNQKSESFLNDSKRKKLLKMLKILFQNFPKYSTIQHSHVYGYHNICFLLKIISKQASSNYFYSSNKTFSFLKQFTFFISLHFIHPLFNLIKPQKQRHSIKFFNTIVESLVTENDVFILKICLQFIQDQSILNFSVHKLKSLFKLLTDIAKKLKKMQSIRSNKNIQLENKERQQIAMTQHSKQKIRKTKQSHQVEINEQVQLAKLKISRIIKIFEQLTDIYRDKSAELLFSNSKSSILNLEKIKHTNSLMFYLRIYDRRRSYAEPNEKKEKITFPKTFVSEDFFRLAKFIVGKSQTYEVFLKVAPVKNSQMSQNICKSFSYSSHQVQTKNSKNFFNEFLSNQTYVGQIIILHDEKIIVEDYLKVLSKVTNSYFELNILITCNKSSQSKGCNILIKINEKLIDITSKQKRNQITSFCIGLNSSSNLLNSIVKNFYCFNKEIPENILQKHDLPQNYRALNLIQFLGQESVTYKISQSSQQLIQDLKKQQGFFFKKQLRYSYHDVIKQRSLSFVEIFKQIGGLNSIFYIMDKINKSYANHFGEKSQYFFIQIFKILKNVAANDKENFIFEEVKKSYSYICHFLFLIFKRNQHLTNQRNCHFIESIFKFLMFFSAYFTKDQSIKQYSSDQVFQMQLNFIKEVLAHFELWSQCSLQIQSYIFQTLQYFIKSQKYIFALFSIDLHSKILSSMTFFYTQDTNPLKNKFEQKILLLMENLYDKCIQIYDEKLGLDTLWHSEYYLGSSNSLSQNNREKSQTLNGMSKEKQKQNLLRQKKSQTRVLTKKDLVNLLDKYIHRDINQTMGLIYLLTIYHGKHFNSHHSNEQKEYPSQKSIKSTNSNMKNFMQSLQKSGKKSFISVNFSGNMHLPIELKTIINLVNYFGKNFVDKQYVFSKIGQDWSYVINLLMILQQQMLQTRGKIIRMNSFNRQQSHQSIIIIRFLELMFKIIFKVPQFYNSIINTLQKIILFPSMSFLQTFYLVSEIISINKRFKFDIYDTVFFLLNKKLKLYDSKIKLEEICIFFNENDIEKVLYKMADSGLTCSREFDEFFENIIQQINQLRQQYFFREAHTHQPFPQSKNQIKTNLNQTNLNEIQQPKLETSDRILDGISFKENESKQKPQISLPQQNLIIKRSRNSLLKIFTQYEDILFSICYQTGQISSQNRRWIQNYFSKKYRHFFEHSVSILSHNILQQKRINIESNFKIGQLCSTNESVYFMLNVFQKLCAQQKEEQLTGKVPVEQLLNEPRQLSSISENNQTSKTTYSQNSIIEHKKQMFVIQTQQQINSQILSLLQDIEPISFFLSNPRLDIEGVYIFFKGIEQFKRQKVEYSFFNTNHGLSLLFFVNTYIYSRVIKYLFQKYSYNDQTTQRIEKPMQGLKRKQNTLKCIQILRYFFDNAQLDCEGLYNCLVSQNQMVNLKNLRVSLNQPISKQKKMKTLKQMQTSLKRFVELWFMNNNNLFKINPHDRQKIKTPKKLMLQQKNLYDTLFQKLRFVCLQIQNQEQKINELFIFFNQQTKGSNSKPFSNLINRIVTTLRYVLQMKNIMTVTQYIQELNEFITLVGCPKNPSPSLSMKTIQQYKQSLILKFNKILQSERRKSEKSENEFKKNEKENQFWLEIQEKDYEKKDQIFELDQKQTGPFGFYKLNIKPSIESIQQIHYPRRKMFASIKNSQTSNNENQPDDNADQSILLSKTRMLDLSFTQADTGKQRRNTLLEISPIKNTAQTVQGPRTSVNPLNNYTFLCEMVTKRGVYAGKLIVKNQYIEFKYLSHLCLPDEAVYRLSTGKFHQINSLSEEQRSKLSSLRILYKRCKLFTRRYILRHTAVELFSRSLHSSFFFNLFLPTERQRFLGLTRQKFEECLQNKQQQFMKRQFTQQWKVGQLSNFEYLCLINQYSGRSTNDLAQYYVFPWVVTNYSGKNGFKEINEEFLNNKENLRDLTCPPGKLNEEKFMKLKMRLDQLDFCGPQERFLYGTMFSNPTVLYNFFIRLQPFIHLHWQHQGKRIDHADRLFFSIQQQFSSVLIASSDMKELTPQFYYWPQFLKNRSYIDLGQKQNKQEVDDVVLPIWAHSPEQFVFKLRFVLESNQVSQKLHQWIDLTFGYKVKYENAEEFDNLYHYNCYERQLDYFEEFKDDEKQIKSLQVSISQFGQIPEALFDDPHPQKNLRHEFLIIDRFLNVKYEKPNPKENSPCQVGFQTCKQGIFVWTTTSVEFKKSYINQNYSYDDEKKTFSSIGKNARLLSFQDQGWLTLNQGVLRIFIKRVLKYEKNLDAECLDIIGLYFIYSIKSSLIVSQYDYLINSLISKKVLYGHKSSIVFIKSSKTLDLILSIDLEGFAIIHELQSLTFLRNFQLPLQDEWCENMFRSEQSSSMKDKKLLVEIHQMGYFIFLLNAKKLVVVTFLGQIFFETDIEIPSLNRKQQEKITELIIFRHDQSAILIGTSFGNIYLIDFIQIKRHSQLYPFKTFTNITVNILQHIHEQFSPFDSHNNHTNSKSTKKSETHKSMTSKMQSKDFRKSIKKMTVEKIPGDKISMYQIVVQYEDGDIVCLYEQKYLGKQLRQNEKLKQIGLFF